MDGGSGPKRGLSGSGRLAGRRQQLVQAADRCYRNPIQHVPQVVEGIDLVPLTGGDEAEEYGGGVPAIVTAAEHPVAPAHRDPAQGPFTDVVVDVQIPVRGTTTRDAIDYCLLAGAGQFAPLRPGRLRG